MKTEIKNRLISLLESGEYNKATGQLYVADTDCHCVLGVLIEYAIDEDVFEPVVEQKFGRKAIANLDSFTLNREIREWAGLTPNEASILARVNDNSLDWKPVIEYIKENL